jgi:NifB/MoaA-like Fe-S oxidoreductase
MERWVKEYGPAGVQAAVQPIRNTFFGETITVTGLITGGDLMEQLKNADEDEILLCGNTLRAEGDLFLDGVSLEQVRRALMPRLTVVPNTGADLFRALLGRDFSDDKGGVL